MPDNNDKTLEKKVEKVYPAFVSTIDDQVIYDFLLPEQSQARVLEAIQAFREGKYVAIIEQKKEKEADLGFYVRNATPEKIGEFMDLVRDGGSFCVAFSLGYLEPYIRTLGDESAIMGFFDPEKPNFVNIVDSDRGGTGWQASDRYLVIEDLLKRNFSDIKDHGHTFLLKGHPGGLKGRIGHTESYIDLAKLAGLEPAGAIFQEMAYSGDNPAKKGQKLWGYDLVQFLHGKDLVYVSTRDIYKYEKEHPDQISQLRLM